MKLRDILKENNVSVKILLAIGIASAVILIYGVWTTSHVGSISIFVPEKSSTIFLDGKKVDITNSNKQTVNLKQIHAGEHSVLVHSTGYYPWEKKLIVTTGKNTEASAFFIRQKFTPAYKKTEFTKDKLDSISLLFENTNNKISFSGDGNVKIKKEGKNITAVWLGDKSSIPYFFCNDTICKNSILVFFSNTKQIGNIGFYPHREDVILFSVGNGIYAIEIDKRGTQNFQPVYIGKEPNFAVDEQNSILYVKDGDSLFGIKL
jgi:hypothetical protein